MQNNIMHVPIWYFHDFALLLSCQSEFFVITGVEMLQNRATGIPRTADIIAEKTFYTVRSWNESGMYIYYMYEQ